MTTTHAYALVSTQRVTRPILIPLLVMSLLLLVLVSTACSASGSSSTSSPSSGDELTPAEKEAIKAVQQYSADGSNKVLDWLTIALAAKKGMGDNIDLSGAYWSARQNGQRIQVRFFYKEDGKWQYAEWRYVPSTGYVAGENEMGRLTVR
jgi:hypothetical protein